MHHTLLTDEKRGALHREYVVRVIIVCCFVLSLVGIIGIVSLVPVLFKITREESISREQVSKIAQGKNKDQTTMISNALARDQILVSNLKKNIESYSVSRAIDTVVGVRGKIKITSLSIAKQATSTVSVSVQGVSPNRDELLAFKSRIENISQGLKVVLPISELVKSSNFPFTLQITSLPI